MRGVLALVAGPPSGRARFAEELICCDAGVWRAVHDPANLPHNLSECGNYVVGWDAADRTAMLQAAKVARSAGATCVCVWLSARDGGAPPPAGGGFSYVWHAATTSQQATALECLMLLGGSAADSQGASAKRRRTDEEAAWRGLPCAMSGLAVSESQVVRAEDAAHGDEGLSDADSRDEPPDASYYE
eukprot:Hpha_TRINITY_DN6857_c0_g1::TRINITY_DN6857_c0_g1_i3::g.46245::m.46245